MTEVDEVFIEDELTCSYLSYAMSVIVGRALPDVRDGLKPVHRRILFVMKELSNVFDKNYKKSARIVGEVIGKYHPHGEVAVYDSIVRLSQPFVQRYVLIDGQGNFGSIDGDSPAAMRYTEIRMSEISDFLLKELDFFVVDFVDNYDSTEKQPVVLPAMFPNLLVNGACGIAVGMATNIPPHNLCEIIDACLLFLDNFDVNIDELLKVVLAPDFPTAGVIYSSEGLHKIYKTGKGKFFLRANTIIESDSSGNYFIVVNEIPYQVNKSKLIESIVSLIDNCVIDGIRSIRDESDKNGLRIFIELHKSKDPNIILNKLFLHTKMQISYNVNMVALVDNFPKLLNLRDFVKYFIDHRKEIVYRRSKYKLVKAERKAHLLEGLGIALFNLDNIIKLIVSSNEVVDLFDAFKSYIWNVDIFYKSICKVNESGNNFYIFSDIQIQSILDMKLIRLTKIEKDQLIKDYCSLLNEIDFYKSVLYDNLKLRSIIKDELLFIRNKFGDKRKTKIAEYGTDISFSELVIKEDIVFIVSDCGYIKAQLLNKYITQHRGGKGKLSIFIKPGDFITNFLVCDTHSVLLFFSTFGKAYWFDLSTFPLSSRQSMGTPVINLLKIAVNEKISFVLPIKDYGKDKYVFMATKKGLVKKILLSSLETQRSNGVIVIDLLDNDVLVGVKIIGLHDVVMLFSKFGRAIRFFSKDVRCTSRTSRGMSGMKLQSDDYVVSLLVSTDAEFVLIASEHGYGKRTKISEYSITKRGVKGIMCIRIDKKNGSLVCAEKVFETNDLLLISNSGIISRIKIKEVSCTGRFTRGVPLISLSKDEKLIGIKEIEGDV